MKSGVKLLTAGAVICLCIAVSYRILEWIQHPVDELAIKKLKEGMPADDAKSILGKPTHLYAHVGADGKEAWVYGGILNRRTFVVFIGQSNDVRSFFETSRD
jgi:hypothetical protein